jgi:hypothetical protein
MLAKRHTSCGLLVTLMGGLALLSGCNKEPPPITKQTYTIPAAIVKQQEAEARAEKKFQEDRKRFEEMKKAVPGEAVRMLAALAPQPGTDFFWTFKLQGAPDELEKIKPDFIKLLGSLQWDNENKGGVLPLWQFPPGSRVSQQEDGFGRVATITLSDEFSNLQIAVAKFTNTGDWEQAALTNINRWRGQLRLDPISADALDTATKKIPYTGDDAILVDETGTAGPRPGMTPPVAAKQQQPEATPPPTTAAPPKSDPAKLVEYTAPEAWKSKEGSSLRIATFSVTQGEETAEVAITQFPKVAQMTDPLANVNRWRGELALPPAKESELPEQTSVLKIGDQPATIFFATGTRGDQPASTLAAMIVRENRVWFVKMQGAATLVSKQRPAFEEFVKSLKFND